MTVSTAYAPLSYAGNAATTVFPVTWPFLSGTLVVTKISATGTETTLSISTHYSVTGGTDSDGLAATGSITMVTAPASGETLVIARATPKTQPTTWAENDPFPQKVIEAAFDRNILLTQEQSYGTTINLGLNAAGTAYDAKGLPVNNSTAGSPLVTQAGMETYVAAFAVDDVLSAAASAAAAAASASQLAASYTQPSSSILYQHVLLDDIASGFNGSTATFNLAIGGSAFTPSNAAQLVLHLNGVYQKPGTDYTVSTTTITFTTVPYSGDSCIILAMRTNADAASIGFTPYGAGGIAATTVQAAIQELADERQLLDSDLTAIAALTTTTFGRALLTGADAAAIRSSLGIGLGTGDLVAANNLSDVASATTARTNLGVRTAVLDDISASFNGSLTTFNLAVSAAAFTPRSAQGIMCIYNGVVQVPGSAFTVSTSTITFTFTPASGDTCSLWAVNT